MRQIVAFPRPAIHSTLSQPTTMASTNTLERPPAAEEVHASAGGDSLVTGDTPPASPSCSASDADASTSITNSQQQSQTPTPLQTAAEAPAVPPAEHATTATTRKLLVVLHGKRLDDDLVRNAIQELKAQGHELTVRVTWDSGDVDLFVKEAIEMWDTQQYHTLVGGGGDGTLNELVVALLKHNAPQHISVAQLPLGTANDLASAAGISLNPYEALQLALDPSNIHPVDVALVNGEVFTNLATAGPVSGVSSKEMSTTLKKVLGPAAVAVAGLKHLFVSGLPPIKNVRLTYPKTADVSHSSYTPDQVSHMHGDLLALAAGQARQMGRMVNLCPDALLDDGLLDFTLLFGSLGKQARELAADVASSGLDEAQGGLKLLRLPWLLVEADEDLKCNRDGEPMQAGDSNRLLFEVIPRRINMHLPDRRLLVEGQQQQSETSSVASDSSSRQGGGVGGGKSGAKGFRWLRQKAMRTGAQRRPALLRDLWRAQQPPGRLSRVVPRLQKLLGRTLIAVSLMAVGFTLGFNAQQQWASGGGVGAGGRSVCAGSSCGVGSSRVGQEPVGAAVV